MNGLRSLLSALVPKRLTWRGQTIQMPRTKTILCSSNNLQQPLARCLSSSAKEFDTPSPYKPGKVSLRYGYEMKYFNGGLLPRPKDSKIKLGMPDYKPKDNWNEKRALFGQNDYIDILGDGSIQPKELINGPVWLVGFRGNQMQRIIRRLHFTGPKLKAMKPKLHDDLHKQMRFFYKKKNLRRTKTFQHGRHVG